MHLWLKAQVSFMVKCLASPFVLGIMSFAGQQSANNLEAVHLQLYRMESMLLTIHFGMLSGSWQHPFIKASEPQHAPIQSSVFGSCAPGHSVEPIARTSLSKLRRQRVVRTRKRLWNLSQGPNSETQLARQDLIDAKLGSAHLDPTVPEFIPSPVIDTAPSSQIAADSFRFLDEMLEPTGFSKHCSKIVLLTQIWLVHGSHWT